MSLTTLPNDVQRVANEGVVKLFGKWEAQEWVSILTFGCLLSLVLLVIVVVNAVLGSQRGRRKRASGRLNAIVNQPLSLLVVRLLTSREKWTM